MNKNFKKFQRLLPYLLFIFIGFCIAEIGLLSYRDLMLPNKPPPARPKKSFNDAGTSRGAYNTVISRNVFNSEGTIPEALTAAGGAKEEELPPVPSSLPLGLAGTIVFTNPEKSLANIEVRGKNQVLPFIVGQDIEGLATLKKVERGKIIFRNNNNNRMEYIEMKLQGQKLSFNVSQGSGAKSDVQQVAPNKFEVKRSDLQKYLNDMSSILQQASSIPRRGANGEIECYKLVAIQPGSVYTQLGLQNGDCIKAVNGEKVDSPAKAMELYNALKTSNQIKISRERDGRDDDVDYSIK